MRPVAKLVVSPCNSSTINAGFQTLKICNDLPSAPFPGFSGVSTDITFFPRSAVRTSLCIFLRHMVISSCNRAQNLVCFRNLVQAMWLSCALSSLLYIAHSSEVRNRALCWVLDLDLQTLSMIFKHLSHDTLKVKVNFFISVCLYQEKLFEILEVIHIFSHGLTIVLNFLGWCCRLIGK